MIRASLVCLLVFTLLTGALYPAFVTAFAQLAFPHKASGSVVQANGKPVGSVLLGQEFNSPAHFWGRPSATTPPYNPGASTGSNLGPSNPELRKRIESRIGQLRAMDPGNRAPIPADLVTSSGSGLDPHISPEAANWQAERVARARGTSEQKVNALVRANTQGRWLGVFGEPRVNVLALNLALDGKSPGE